MQTGRRRADSLTAFGERVEKLDHVARTAFLRVSQEWNFVRAGHVYDVRVSCDRGFYDLKLAERGSGEKIHARIRREQDFGDIATSHMRRAAERGFEIAAAPIPGRVYDRRLLGQHRFHFFEIAVAGTDEFFYAFALDLRSFIEFAGRGSGPGSLPQQARSEEGGRGRGEGAAKEEGFA